MVSSSLKHLLPFPFRPSFTQQEKMLDFSNPMSFNWLCVHVCEVCKDSEARSSVGSYCFCLCPQGPNPPPGPNQTSL